MPTFHFQKDRKNAPKTFSMYNLSFPNSAHSPIMFPSRHKYAILATSKLTFWHSDTLSVYHPMQARHNGRNISASPANEQKWEEIPFCVHTMSCGLMTARLATPSPPSSGAMGRKPCRTKRFCAQ